MTKNSLDTGLAALAKTFNGESTQDVRQIMAAVANNEHGQQHLQSVAAFFYPVWLQIESAHKNDVVGQSSLLNVLAIKSAVQQAAVMAGTSHHVRTALDYLLLWAEVRQYLKEHKFRLLSYSALLSSASHLSDLDTRLQTRRSNLSTDYGLFMLQGMLRGLSDREGAAALFREAEVENAPFAMSQSVDRFVSTYLSDSDITAETVSIAARRATLMKSFELLEGNLPIDKADTLLLFSCDPAFFAVFFPYWTSTAMYLRERNVHLHFVLIGNYPEVTTTLERGLTLAAATARLRGFAPTSSLANLSFSRVEAPSDVAELRTFYACARFLIARELARKCPARMLILDIDMEVNSDPGDALRTLGEVAPMQLPVVTTSSLLALIPAYRLPACKVLLPGDQLVESVMLDVENYIYAGLSRTQSWLLDQNALDYASGRLIATHGSKSVVDANHCVSSFYQRPIGRLYKRIHLQHRSTGVPPR